MNIALITNNYIPNKGGITNVMVNVHKYLTEFGEKVIVFNKSIHNKDLLYFRALTNDNTLKGIFGLSNSKEQEVETTSSSQGWCFSWGNAITRGCLITGILLGVNGKWLSRTIVLNENYGLIYLIVLLCLIIIIVSGLKKR